MVYTYAFLPHARCVSVGMLPNEPPAEVDPDMTEKEKEELDMKEGMKYQRRVAHAPDCIIPGSVEEEINSELQDDRRLKSSVVSRIIGRIENWYRENGYAVAQVVRFSQPGWVRGNEIVFEVDEGHIGNLDIKFEDSLGNACEGKTNVKLIERALAEEEVAIGQPYNMKALQRVVQNLDSLNIFSRIGITPERDETNGGAVSLQIVVQEPHDYQWSDVQTKWNVVRRPLSLPTIVRIPPGATISFGKRNIKGLNRSFEGNLTFNNFLNPQDDVDFKFEYTHPYLDGIDNPRNRKFQAVCFNSRKLSPVFRGGPHSIDIPIWVDRQGIKATITEVNFKQTP
ncbi:Protein TOC75-3- chloroplastic [Striga hermonthica]|uniref:Protein TOC75-3- chloroplastic n=1 Tax=Striga hermonthica TaxID=68872 RepID=A0A9N7MCX6_STRHE|nr:Protein TOC75-3- chloroplastic [Striga hermonthica]